MEFMMWVLLAILLILFFTVPPFFLGFIVGLTFRWVPPKVLAGVVGVLWGIVQFAMRSDMFMETIESTTESMAGAGIQGPSALLPLAAAATGWTVAILLEVCFYYAVAFLGVELARRIAKRFLPHKSQSPV